MARTIYYAQYCAKKYGLKKQKDAQKHLISDPIIKSLPLLACPTRVEAHILAECGRIYSDGRAKRFMLKFEVYTPPALLSMMPISIEDQDFNI
jgi:hypothetical protein